MYENCEVMSDNVLAILSMSAHLSNSTILLLISLHYGEPQHKRRREEECSLVLSLRRKAKRPLGRMKGQDKIPDKAAALH